MILAWAQKLRDDVLRVARNQKLTKKTKTQTDERKKSSKVHYA